MMKMKKYQFWFCTGSQDLYGDECLRHVAEHSKIMVERLNASGNLPYELVWKPTLLTNEMIRKTFNEANLDENCAGVITWCHTFSPAKSWIMGLQEFRKPLLHFHTHAIVSNGDVVSKHNFRLPETISLPHEVNGKDYDDHLFVDDSGKARINLNTWEEGVLVEEQSQADYVCWLRNPPRKPWSLCIPYEMGGEQKPAYPDFVIIRKDSDDEYVVDILEPHDPTRIDNLGKARGFAEYARQNPGVGRIQLIRMSKDAVGHNRFKRLDMAMSAVRDKVSRAMTNDELDHIFDTDGFFM